MSEFDIFLRERFSGKYDSMEAMAAKLVEVENEHGDCWKEISNYLKEAMVFCAMREQGYMFEMGWKSIKNETPAGGAAGESE